MGGRGQRALSEVSEVWCGGRGWRRNLGCLELCANGKMCPSRGLLGVGWEDRGLILTWRVLLWCREGLGRQPPSGRDAPGPESAVCWQAGWGGGSHTSRRHRSLAHRHFTKQKSALVSVKLKSSKVCENSCVLSGPELLSGVSPRRPQFLQSLGSPSRLLYFEKECPYSKQGGPTQGSQIRWCRCSPSDPQHPGRSARGRT